MENFPEPPPIFLFSVATKLRKGDIAFLSPPVHVARWAHMHRCLSVRPSVCHWTIIHISESIIAMNLKLYHNIKPL